MCPHVTAAASPHDCQDEKPAGEDVPEYVISHTNREQREIVGLPFDRLGLPPLCHLSDATLPLLNMGAAAEPYGSWGTSVLLRLNRHPWSGLQQG